MKNTLFLLFIFSFFLSFRVNAKTIGITIDYRKNTNQEHQFTKTSFYAIRDNYISSFQGVCKKYGVTILPIPLDVSMVDEYVKMFDGMVFSGNYYDVDPALYGQKPLNASVKLDDKKKNEFEMALFKSFYKTKKPIFGICGGYQTINVALGGELYQDIPTQIKESKINHASGGETCSHGLNILEKSGALNYATSKMDASDKICVNSSHHQAISRIAPELEVTAMAPDNVIEAYKAKNHPFLIGVQWHPEYELSAFDTAIMERFCKEVGGI